MAEVASCIVTHVIANGGPGFAIRADNDEQVFISFATCRVFDLQEGDEIETILVANRNADAAQPWFVYRVLPDDVE